MDVDTYTRFGLALLAVIGLILLVGVLLHRFGPMVGSRPAGGRSRRRLGLVESAMVDARRRLLLVRCDDREHLLLIGGTHDLVIDRDIAPPAPPQGGGPSAEAGSAAPPTFRSVLMRGREDGS